jgi:hypothetical protein
LLDKFCCLQSVEFTYDQHRHHSGMPRRVYFNFGEYDRIYLANVSVGEAIG